MNFRSNGIAHQPLGMDAVALSNLQLAPLKYLLEPWLPENSMSLLWAMRETGKTHIALGIAHAIATGGQFLKWRAPAPRKVCYIDGEVGKRGIKGWLADMGLTPSEELKNLHFITLEEAPNGIIWNLTTPVGQEVYSRIVADYDLIIVDNLTTVARAGGRGLQSDVEQWASVQVWALQQRAKGKSLIFLHHAGKSGEQRGTSMKEDAMDTVISLRRDKDHDPEHGIDCCLAFEKARYLVGADREALRVKLVRAFDGGPSHWVYSSQKEHFKKRFIQMAKDGRSMVAMMAALGVSRDVYEIMKDKHAAEINGESAPTWTDTRKIADVDEDTFF